MSTATIVSLSPRAAAARSQITALKQRIDELGMTAINTLIEKIIETLDEHERAEIKDVLEDIGPETPEQARTNACVLLRKLGLRPVAMALENAQLELKWTETMLTKAIGHVDVPEWVCAVIQVRLDAVKTTIERMANPRPKQKTSAPKSIGTARDRISALLDQMRQGRWVYNLIRDEVAALNGEAPTVADLMKLVEQEKDPCWEKSRAPASEHLERLGHGSAAGALYGSSDGAEEAISKALGDKRVHGWVKAMLTYRLHQIREERQEQQFADHRLRAISDVEKLAGLIGQIDDILNCAAESAAVGVQQALLTEAQSVYEDAEAIQFFLPALEGVIAGKSGTDNSVIKILAKDAELAKKVDLALAGKKASALRWGLLNSAKDGIAELAEMVERRTPVQSEPTKKNPRPRLWVNASDHRRSRR